MRLIELNKRMYYGSGYTKKASIYRGFFYFRRIMVSIYILHSIQLDRFYIGSCKDLSYRLNQHLNKEFSKSFTAKADDWTLFFSKDDLSYAQARSIEKHIKSMKSKTYLQNLKQYPDIFNKLLENLP